MEVGVGWNPAQKNIMAKYEMSFSSQKVEGFQDIAKTIQVNKGGRKDFFN